ncbi:VCBS repeat-containing protein [Tateyamaria armeniaca]|uniref:VCBS repeat-containing protein n=1 Tax=Tateyamaria armeniaca TaxID=2518930 RepID=A0ABW8UYK2_9RHOB
MTGRAPRLLMRLWGCCTRGALLATALVAGAPVGAEIEAAYYDIPTDQYGHGVLPGGEYAALGFRLSGGREIGAGTSGTVYEDTAPRLVDLDGDGTNEVITVVSYFDRGAALRIFDEVKTDDHPSGTTIAVVAETPPIGTPFRWLAVVGAADLDGDGIMEIAYVDRPHLAKTLRIWRYKDAVLNQVATFDNVTNHRIGEPDIAGGIRDCGSGPEMVVATGNWSTLLAIRWDGSEFAVTDLGRDTTRPAFARAMACAE